MSETISDYDAFSANPEMAELFEMACASWDQFAAFDSEAGLKTRKDLEERAVELCDEYSHESPSLWAGRAVGLRMHIQTDLLYAQNYDWERRRWPGDLK